jgi:hypothetical protein
MFINFLLHLSNDECKIYYLFKFIIMQFMTFVPLFRFITRIRNGSTKAKFILLHSYSNKILSKFISNLKLKCNLAKSYFVE